MSLKSLPPYLETASGFIDPSSPLDESDPPHTMLAAGLKRGRRNWFPICISVEAAPTVVPPSNDDPIRHAVYTLPDNISPAPAILIERLSITAWDDERFLIDWKAICRSRHATTMASARVAWWYTTSNQLVRELPELDLGTVALDPGEWKARKESRYLIQFQTHFDLLTRTDIKTVFKLCAERIA